VATSADVLRAELTRTLPKRRELTHGNGSVAHFPTRSLIAPVIPLPSSADMDQPQVSILDGDPAVAHTIARILQAEGFVARTWTSARAFMAQPEPALAGCLIADATMPDMTGLEVQRELAARQWPLPVIFLTRANDITMAVRGMKAGAINCLPKPVQRGELLEAVREAFSESRAVRAQRAVQLRVRQMLGRLTPREREVLDLAVTGLLVKQIAARLGTAEKTVKTHKGRLMRKMQVRSTLALVQLMLTAGLSPAPSLRLSPVLVNNF
jgi:FixJ family two-component response regulator